MMDRRAFIGRLTGLVAAPLAVEAQPGKVWRIGFLAGGRPPANHKGPFHQGLDDLGYIEGRNILIEYRYAEGNVERLPALAAELVALKVDVVVTGAGTQGALAAKQATRTTPVVFIGVGDPVASGVVTSLAQPGGNVTGLSSLVQDLVGKCLEQLKQAVPGVSRVAVLWQPGEVGELAEKDRLKRADVAARALAVRLQFVEARRSEDIVGAFSAMTRAHADALTVLSSTMFFSERTRLVDLGGKEPAPDGVLG